MTFATANLAASLAAYLAPYFPGVTFYPGPNQQGTEPPCMFLQQRYNYPDLQQDGRRRLRIGLDLAYLLDYNLPNMQLQYQEAADALNVVMETFPYSDGADTALLRTYDKEARIDLDALHYKFEVRVWVSLPETPVMMQTMDYTEDVTNGQT